MVKHFAISIKSSGLSVLINKQEIEDLARKYLNFDKMKITLEKDHVGWINFILNYDKPFVNYDSNEVCSASRIFQKLSDDFENAFDIKFKTIDVYEMMSTDEVKGDDIVSRGQKVLGGLAGYLIGGEGELLRKWLCEYEFHYGILFTVYKDIL